MRGYSSMASVGGKVFTVGDTLSTENDEKEYLLCFNGETGKLIWKAKLGDAYKHPNEQWESSRSTPTVDADHVYILTGNGDVICLETASGREIWRKSLPDDFGGKKGDGWGYSESILIDGNKAICTPGGDTTLVAFDKLTGKTLWTSALPEKPRRRPCLDRNVRDRWRPRRRPNDCRLRSGFSGQRWQDSLDNQGFRGHSRYSYADRPGRPGLAGCRLQFRRHTASPGSGAETA